MDRQLEDIVRRLLWNDPELTDPVVSQLNDERTDTLAASMRDNVRMQSLLIRDSMVSHSDPLRNLLENSRSLLRLEISDCGRLPVYLFQALRTPASGLRTLVVRNSKCFGEECGEALKTMLEVNTSLRELHLISTWMDSASVKQLAEGLSRNRTLQQLVLDERYVGLGGVQAISDCLAVNKHLVKLKLDATHYGNKGLASLAASLIKNETLQELELCNCGKGTDHVGVVAFGEALPRIRSLRRLVISGSSYFGMDRAGWEALVRGMLWNTDMESLELECETFTERSLWNLYKRQISYLQKNKWHRRALYETNVRESLWPLILEQVDRKSPNPLMLFHLLKEKPGLISDGIRTHQ